MPELISTLVSPSDGLAFDDAIERPKKPRFPHGLMISLNEEVISKLGIKTPPVIGEVLTLEAKVVVTGLHMEATGEDKHINLQITEMGLGMSKHEETEDKFFGGRKESPSIIAMEDN